jgi:regulator of protease activity HflC (stomatin/prohibitin superfamily)
MYAAISGTMAGEDIFGCCTAVFFIGIPAFFILSSFVRIIYDYEKGLILTLGKFSGMRGSGVQFIIPLLQTVRIVDLRIQTIDIPKQEVLSKDNVSAFINAVVYFKIIDPQVAIFNVQDYRAAVYQHSQTAIRDVVGSRTLDQLLTDRKSIAETVSSVVEKDSKDWGVDITGIKIQDIGLPDTMKRAMARQAQAEREKRASIIVAEGENMAAEKLAAAAKILSESPGAMHLRTLQMVSSVSADKTNIMNFVLPIEGVQIPDRPVDSKPEAKPREPKK